MSQTVKLVIQNETVEVPRNIAEQSILIKDMLADVEDDDAQEIPLPDIKTKEVLDYVVEFCKMNVHDPIQEIEKPIKSTELKGIMIPPQYAEYAERVSKDQSVLFDVILAANYLNVPGLLDMTCATVATMIKGKTPEEIKKTFKMDDTAAVST